MASPSSDGADLPDDIANRMSLFYANPTPMLNTLSGATSKLLQEVQCVGVYGGWWKRYRRCSVGQYQRSQLSRILRESRESRISLATHTLTPSSLLLT